MPKTTITFTSEEISIALKEMRLDKTSQIGRIAEEILKNIKNYEFDRADDKGFYIRQISEVINVLLSSYIKDNEIAGLLTYPKEIFDEDLVKITPSKQDKAKSLYKTFWRHQNIGNLIAINGIHKNEYDELEVSNLDATAAWYLSYDWMKSETLNWLLIDALLFAENISYARFVVPYAKNNLTKFIKSFFYLVISEGFKLLLTGLASGFILSISSSNSYSDINQSISFWIIFSAITVSRWLNPNKIKTANNDLLLSMISVYGSKLKSPNFYPDLLKKMLYDLEIKGAVYSPNIYFILEKKY